MATRIECPNCQEPVYVREGVDASRVKCPACGVDIADGEAPDELLELAREQEQEAALASSVADQRQSHWSSSPVVVRRSPPSSPWLVHCSDCGATVSRTADRCPNCGGDPKRILRMKVAGGCFLVLVAFFGIAAVLSAVSSR